MELILPRRETVVNSGIAREKIMTETKTRQYPTLSEMGVESLKEIRSFYITGINYIDVLRIVYERPKNSFLAYARTYKFPRIQEDEKGTALITHPKLRAAQKELREILESKSSKETIASEILNEIELLEEDIAIRSKCLKELASKIPSVD